MKLDYRRSEDLPPLAWVATSDSDSETICVLHGSFVETHPHLFVEGAWAGDFSADQLAECDVVFGSGGGVTDGYTVFVSSTATTDFLYHNDDADHFCISNSLPLLLATLGDGLDTVCEDYSRINMSILDGIRRYHTAIPTRNGQVRRVMHHNIRFKLGSILHEEKPVPPQFGHFEEYRDYVQDKIRKLFSNARHPARQCPLQIYSTQSRGYDSTAVNALAAPFGIDKVFTSPESKERGNFYIKGRPNTPSDDGTEICTIFGLPCVRVDRRSFETKPSLHEEYYWAGLDNNQDLNLHEIQSFIERPTLLLTGNLGEIWYTREAVGKTRPQTSDDELSRWDQTGHGLGEVRLKAGMVQVAIPFIGARRRTELLQITESDEMAPWRLNNNYDRPIPRRIAEEAGIPREMFGQMKLASIVHLPTPNVPVTPSLRAEFFRYLVDNRLFGRIGIRLLPAIQRFNNWIYWKNPTRYFNDRRRYPRLWYAGYAYAKLFGAPPRFRMLCTRIDSHLYAFCVNKVRDEYARHLSHVRLSAGRRAPTPPGGEH